MIENYQSKKYTHGFVVTRADFPETRVRRPRMPKSCRLLNIDLEDCIPTFKDHHGKITIILFNHI